jgi:7-carboxy-7-deazaguanine synthase
MRYPVNEVFLSIQGEGVHAGRRAVFVRLQGCPVGCQWCDTKHTWPVLGEDRVQPPDVLLKDRDSSHHAMMYADDILEAVTQLDDFGDAMVVITGGEPALYDLRPLTEGARLRGRTVQVETSGTHGIECDQKTWVTVSPKYNMPGGFQVLGSVLERANEIKIVIARESDLDRADALLAEYGAARPVYIQPVSANARLTALCVDRVTRGGGLRLSLQMHKFAGIR